jgi:long-chain acyl-CoA synthetase
LRDRSKDMIIGGGSSIYPGEIEEVLLRHPDLIEVSVVGHPHRQRGEKVVAFRFVDALPKNNYGKVLKTELRRLAEPER